MFEWIEGLTVLQKVFFYTALPFSLVLIIQIILSLVGLGHGGADGADGADADGDGVPDQLDADGDGTLSHVFTFTDVETYAPNGTRYVYTVEEVTDGFLADHPDFTRTPFTLPAPAGETDGQLTLWPQRHGTDGFYICRMERRV